MLSRRNLSQSFNKQSIGFPSNREQQLKFKQLLEDLTKDQLISFAAGKIAVPIRGDDKKYNLPVIFIKAIDIAAFENKINKKLKEKHPITQQQFGLTETRLKNLANTNKINPIKQFEQQDHFTPGYSPSD